MFYSIMTRSASVEGRLFLAALPDAATAGQIFRLASVLKRAHRLSGKLIVPERLHLSLFFLGGLTDQLPRAVGDAVTEARVAPFEVSFDRAASFRGRAGSRPFVLVGGNGLDQVKSFRRALAAELAQQGFRSRAKTNFEPHVTLLYDDRSVEEYPVAGPISWIVNELVLIHSLNGHQRLARWPLRV